MSNETLDMFGEPERQSDVPQKPATVPYVYRCVKHNYVLETSFPAGIGNGLKPFCPICRDEFLAKHIPVLVNENTDAGKPVAGA